MQGHHELSEQIYRRIYRLHQQKADPRLIAAALNMPLITIQHVLERLRAGQKPHSKDKHPAHGPANASRAAVSDELVAFTFSKVRYAIVDVTGPLVGKNSEILARELNAVLNSEFKAVAIQTTEITALDLAGIKVILDFQTSFSAKGRYSALLDPNPGIEPMITENQLDEKIPVFGTERAFEEAAFSVELDSKSKKQPRHPGR